MELGKLTLLCFNFICVGAVSLLVFWILIHVQVHRNHSPRIYSEPPPAEKRTLLSFWRGAQDDGYHSPEKQRVEG